MEKKATRHPASYRDSSGFMYTHNGTLYRQVNKVFAASFDSFVNNGCYDKLVKQGLLIPHQIINTNFTESTEWHTTLQPSVIPVISYPYEWSFDMLKDAALLTLRLMKESIANGFILKDATPYNVQWYKGKFVFIDTLSFEPYNELEPWVAYRQFCEQFLAPLLLALYKKIPSHNLMQAWPDGVPLPIAASLLPLRTRFSLHTYLHIHLHAKAARKKNGETNSVLKFSKQKLLNIINSLETVVNHLKLPAHKSTWSDYYKEAGERDNYLKEKDRIITEWVNKLIGVSTATDLGANDGRYAKLIAEKSINVVAADFDPWCVNKLYSELKAKQVVNVQPMVVDISNPPAGSGVNNEERASFIKRGKADLILSLALIHHLAIGKNIPFDTIALFFNNMTAKYLIIEFVPKEDEKVQIMLSGRKDIFTAYTQLSFKNSFEKYFFVLEVQPVAGSGRTLLLMGKR